MANESINLGGSGSSKGAVRYDKEQTLTDPQKAQARSNIGVGASASDAVSYGVEQSLTEVQKETACTNIGAAKKNDECPNLIAGDLVSINDRVEVADKFVIRTTAGDESIDSKKEALLLRIVGGCGSTEDESFKIHSLVWNKSNLLDPSAWAQGKTSGYITGVVSEGVIGAGSNKLCIIRCPECEYGNYGTAEKNNGFLITSNAGANMYVGDNTVIGVWHCATLPAQGSEVTAVTEHTFTGHIEKFYLPEEGYMIVEMTGSAILANYSIHLAWSKDYNVFHTYSNPDELVVAVSPLTSAFNTETINGNTCLVLRGIEVGCTGIYDRITIYPEGGVTYERNIAAQLLTSLTWTETEIEGEGEGVTSGYRYTAPLPTTGTYEALRDGLIRSDIEGINLEGYTLSFDSSEQIDPATDWSGKYVDYQMATPVNGTHTINPSCKIPDDMGTEEIIGGSAHTGTIVISYMRGFKDTMRALLTDFRKASEKLALQEMTQPLYCVGEWIENANTASPLDQDNPDALAVFGNKEWALDWRPFLVDMSAVEGETKKRPVMELKKNNWLRDIYGNWAPVVGITAAMRDECMANALYSDDEGQTQYCASGAFDPEAFLSLCSIVTEDGVKKLSHPTLYKAVTVDDETTYSEVSHYLMPWETTETKYSIFVGRKDEVYLLDNLVGASGKEWNGILGSNCNFWDGVDVKTFGLRPTGICPSSVTAISENGVTKARSFFYNYAPTVTGAKGYKGTATNCEMFYNNGHYPVCASTQITSKTAARANNHVATNPYPVAEGGWHARNTFLRCLETAWGTKLLGSITRFSNGINSNNSCGNETQFLSYGGTRWRKTGDEDWNYSTWSGATHGIYKNASGALDSMVATLNNYAFHSKTLEDQIAVSFAAEFGIAAGEEYMFNGCKWWYENPTASGNFAPKTVAQGEMNCRSHKIVSYTFNAYNADGTEQSFDVECDLLTGLMLGCNMSGDGGPYWGGGCEIVGECETEPASGSFGYELKAYIQPDQTLWTNESNNSINIGQKFAFEDKYMFAGSIITRSNSYMRRRLPNTPIPASMCGSLSKGECGYGYMCNYWGSAGKRTRVGVRSGNHAYFSYLSARYLLASSSAGASSPYSCGSAQVLLDVQ